MSFTLTCNECGSNECRVDAIEKEHHIENIIVCNECGHED